MILDSEEHRAALLQLVKASSFSGEKIEFVHALYTAIRSAVVSADVRNRGGREASPDDPAGTGGAVAEG